MMFNLLLLAVLVAAMLVPALCDWKSGSFLDDLLSNGKKSTENFEPLSMLDKMRDVLPEDALDRVSVLAHDALDNGVVGKLGYGFMVGYSSGYCVKKVSKAISFVVGAFFIGVQVLASNGYVKVNQDGLKEDVEEAMDLNNDGRIDEKDLKLAFDKLNKKLSYNMPSGGGFTAGLLMGLRA